MGVEGDEARRGGSSSVVRWGRFLPRMAVRVLLVEADDSTRQLITALLRKCHYKVAAVADGLRALEVLKERSRNIDLILTEVDLPSISGFSLLSLITEDDFCKNIPVIMMSSHDSIGTVHKCMMRGASDFLMKPIRINELKNLWQHVWRRQSCHLAMGFGLSLQVESVEQMKIHEATAENNAVSDQSSGSKALSQREEECFKKGSDAQSSCTNPSLEARSAYAEEESQGLSRTKKKLKPLVCDAEVPQADEGSGKNLCPRANMIAGSDMTQGGKVGGQSFLVTGSDLGSQASERTATRAESSREAIDLIGAFDNKGIYGGSCSSNGAKILESSELNLSWRGFQLNGFESNTNRNNVLIQSNASAFSRYTNYKQSQIPIAAAARDVKSWQHSTGEQRFICIDESRKQEQKVGSVDKESVCNCGLRHTNWVGRAASASENGDDDERCLSVAAQHCCTQREAALMKFRLKRKERCYEKKVRYESRKKLADLRPRVKGQFVRRIPPDPPYASVGG